MSVVVDFPDSSGGADYLAKLRAAVPPRFQVDVVPLDPDGLYSLRACEVPKCGRIAMSSMSELCKGHLAAARSRGASVAEITANPRPVRQRPDVHVAGRTGDSFDFRLVRNEVVRLELGLLFAHRADPDSSTGTIQPWAFRRLVQALNARGTRTLREIDQEALEEIVDACQSAGPRVRPMITAARSSAWRVSGDPRAGEILGRRQGGSFRHSRYQAIEATWMRDLVARWVKYRLAVQAVSTQHVGQSEAKLVKFASFCAERGVTDPADLSRDLLIAWADVVRKMRSTKNGNPLSAVYIRGYYTAIDQFLEFLRVECGLPVPSDAKYLAGERPSRTEGLPRFIEPKVMAVMRTPANLLLIRDPALRTAITIMMESGVRAGHVCDLAFDCVIDLGKPGDRGTWALRVLDTKSGQDLALPIPARLAARIRAFQRIQIMANAGTAPEKLFFNKRARVTKQLAPARTNQALSDWVATLGLQDAAGAPLSITPHQFRHTFATEMLEKGVPIEVVKELLGHKSLSATEVYAAVRNERVRKEWEKARLVDAQGEVIAEANGPGRDAEWLLHRMNKATQPLSNGYCGLPIQQGCPHANACINGCDHFMTSAEFLPALIRQRDEHSRFVSEAERSGHLRIAEINRRPMDNLNRIIEVIEGEPGNAA